MIKFDNIYGFYPIVSDIIWMEKLLAWGVKTIQLRSKDSPDIVKDAIKLSKQYDCQCIINDYWQETLHHGGHHLHLGQEDIKSADIKALNKHNVSWGASTHSQQELAYALSKKPDYIALGPIYPTDTKNMLWSPQGLGAIGLWKKQIHQPLVVIGGMTLAHAFDAYRLGANGIAVVSDIVKAPNPQQRVESWLHFFKNPQKQRYEK